MKAPGARCPALLTLLLGLAAFCPVRAEPVPPHLASMASSLYQQAREVLADPRMSPEKREAANRLLQALRRARIRYWARDPILLPGAARRLSQVLGLDLEKESDRKELSRLLDLDGSQVQEALKSRVPDEEKRNEALTALSAARGPEAGMATTHEIEIGGGEAVEIEWEPQSGRVLIRSRSSGKEQTPAYEAALVGRIELEPHPATGDLEARVKVTEDPMRFLSDRDLERIRSSVFGEWVTPDGDRWRFTPADGDEAEGKSRRSPAEIRQDISAARARLDEIERAKEYVWEDEKTGSRIRQRQFRRLGDPWVYRGEEPITGDAGTKMASLREEIDVLQAELSGENQVPVLRDDPVDFDEATRQGAQRILAAVISRDGYAYHWDEAHFDGRRVRGRRTYTKVRDMRGNDIPLPIKRRLIASWSPPSWFELEAEIDLVSREIALRGQVWALRVTYSMGDGFGMGSPEVKSIHTPHARDLLMTRGVVLTVKLDRPPEPQVLSVRFVRRQTGSYTPITDAMIDYGQPFMIEVAFDREPDADQQPVALTVEGGTTRSPSAHKSAESPKRFYTDPISLDAPQVEAPLVEP